MLSKIIDFSIKNKLIVGIFLIFLIGYGSYEVTKLPIDAVPDITNNQVQVITISPALGASDVERLITFPIEQVTSNIPKLIEHRSFSRFGLSVVTLVFEDDVDVYWARQQINERLLQIQDQIPKGLGTPFLGPVSTGLGEIYQYTVRAAKGYEEKYDAMELRTIQDWIVRRQLLGVPGVAEVSSFGGLLKQYEIAVDPAKLLSYNITISDIYDALALNNQNIGGSYIEKGPTVLYIRSEGLLENFSDIESVVVKTLPDGTPLQIKDVAKLQLGHATRYGALTYNGEYQVSGAIVLMLKGENSHNVINAVKDKIAEIQKTLPEGVVIDAFLDRSKMVDNAISTVKTNLLEGALIVVFVLVFFLGNLRAGLLVASVIPLSMLFAIILMNLFGVSGNLMSLGALDFGLIVDGAVIIVEAVMHYLIHSRKLFASNVLTQKQMDGIVQTSASRMMNSAVFGQIIILMVYLPILTLQGIEGKMFIPMAQTVAFALIGAFVLSLTYIPMMATLVLSKKINDKQTFSDRMMSKVEGAYSSFLAKAFRHQKKIITVVLTLFVVAVGMLTRLGGEFIPSLPEGDFAVETRVLTGSNIHVSIDAVSKASKILMEKFPEVEKVVTKTGTSEVPSEPLPIDVSDMIIVLKNRKEWKSAKTYGELEEKMINALEDIPGVTFGFQYPVAMRFNELISGARQDVVCKIYGENLDTLAHYAEKLGNLCQKVDGSSGLYVESVIGMPQIVVKYKRDAIAQYGLDINTINETLNAAFAGNVSGMIYEGERRFDLVVRLDETSRKDLEDVQNLLVSTNSGNQIPLRNVADISIEDGYNQIQRENSQRRIIVGFNVRGRDVESTVNELQNIVENKLKLPAGYFITYGGAFENLKTAKDRLMIVVPVSLLMIFMLLYFAFKSIKQGLLIYTAIPLSAIGGIFALYLRDIPFSISAGVGFIALFGVAVLNGIVLIAEFIRLQKEESLPSLIHVIFKGTRSRLRPVLMTASVASLGFLPMAFSTGEGAEVQRPLATVVIGGLVVATFLTLFVLPILYFVFNRKQFKAGSKLSAGMMVLLVGFSSYGQVPISLDAAIDSALNNNLQLKNQRLLSEYQQQLIKSSATIPMTTVGGQYGQINSRYSDLSLGVTQGFNFPTVYARQKNYLNEEWKMRVLQTNLKEADLRKQVSSLYFQLEQLEQKNILLKNLDSIYQIFIDKSKLRFEKGLNNKLELAVIENNYMQLLQQINQLNQDRVIANLEFNLLLNTESNYSVMSDQHVSISSIDTSLLAQHPEIQLLIQNLVVSKSLTQYEKSKLLPDLEIGYNVMSMRGVGADNLEYGSNLKFHSLNFGVGIPLFSTAQKSRIQAAKTKELIAENEKEIGVQLIKQHVSKLVSQIQNNQQLIDYYQSVSVPNSVQMMELASAQFQNGDIDYLEWTLLTNQAIQVQLDYFDIIKNQSISVVELNYYLSNK